MQYQNFKKKVKQTKGTITNIEISDLQKNDYVGQNDYYIHDIQ